MNLFGERRRHKPRLEIVPMIDVMLLLLVFYILSTVQLHHRDDLGVPVNLPQASTGTALEQPVELTVTIASDGSFYLNKQKVVPEQLGTEVRKLASDTRGGLTAIAAGNVVINADLGVQHRLVVQAMDQLRAVGITHFGIATDEPGTSQ